MDVQSKYVFDLNNKDREGVVRGFLKMNKMVP